MKEHKAALLILIKMGLSDGILNDSESSLIEDFKKSMNIQNDSEELIKEAKNTKLGDLIDRITKYEDKFFIAMRSYSMANVDNDFDLAEQELFERLVNAMDISQSDIDIIKKVGLSLLCEKVDSRY